MVPENQISSLVRSFIFKHFTHITSPFCPVFFSPAIRFVLSDMFSNLRTEERQTLLYVGDLLSLRSIPFFFYSENVTTRMFFVFF
jgi:hypothetical protein